MLVSPAEPAALRALGISSPLPEKMGADFLFVTPQGFVGVQRKTVDDLVSSVSDERLSKEVIQMGQNLVIAELLIEGRPAWTSDGALMGYGRMNRAGWRNLLRSIMAGGIGVSYSDGLDDTIAALTEFARWAGKDVHNSLIRRPGPTGVWGRPDSKEWALHLLQGIDGVGPGVASAIYDYCGGLPLMWTISEAEMLEIPGIGPKRAATMVRALERLEKGAK